MDDPSLSIIRCDYKTAITDLNHCACFLKLQVYSVYYSVHSTPIDCKANGSILSLYIIFLVQGTGTTLWSEVRDIA